jgi:ubiquinone/menaquinone biosynthesis C-methylase UbiE
MKEHELTGVQASLLAWILRGWPRYLLDRFVLGNPNPRIFELLDLKSDEVILDAGAGSGYYSLAIARKLVTGKVISVDVSNALLSNLERQAKRKHLLDYIDIRWGDCAKLPIEDNAIDKAITVLVWHDMDISDAAEEASRELLRVLKPLGKVVAVDLVTKSDRHGNYRRHGFNKSFGEKEMVQILHQASFVNVQAEVTRRLVIGYADKP